MAALYAVCGYCRHILMRTDAEYRDTGEISGIAEDITPFQVGTEGRWAGHHFGIIGRARMAWSDGFWNEWCLLWDDGQFGWLAEAQGQLAVLRERSDSNTSTRVRAWIDHYKTPDELLGETVWIAETAYTVRDIREARCIAAEGELPRLALAGELRIGVDLANSAGGCATIEFGSPHRQLSVFVGDFVTFSDLNCSGLKELEGWPRD